MAPAWGLSKFTIAAGRRLISSTGGQNSSGGFRWSCSLLAHSAVASELDLFEAGGIYLNFKRPASPDLFHYRLSYRVTSGGQGNAKPPLLIGLERDDDTRGIFHDKLSVPERRRIGHTLFRWPSTNRADGNRAFDSGSRRGCWSWFLIAQDRTNRDDGRQSNQEKAGCSHDDVCASGRTGKAG